MTSPTPGDAVREQLLHRQFWLETLRGSLPEAAFAADGRRGAGGAPATLHFGVAPALAERMRKVARDRPLSLHLVLVAGVSVLLHKYTGQEELMLGSPACLPAGSPAEAANLVPLRLRLDPAAGFDAHLRAVGEVAAQAFARQALPFDELVRLLGIAPRDDRWPLFDVLVSLDGLHAPASPRTDLAFAFSPAGGGLAGRVVYRPTLYREATVRRLLAHLMGLLERMLAEPRRSIAEVEVGAAGEGRTFAEAASVFRALPDRLVHELLEEHARREPSRVAVAAGGLSATYGALNARANRMARALRRAGVGPEDLVALHAPRGLDFLASMLAVFKAGAAYLPLDPSSPPRRLSQVLEQSGSRLCLAGDANGLAPVLELVPAERRPRVLPLDGLVQPSDSGLDLERVSAPGSLAYVIYTSGSTGRPKGAQLEQRGMLNHLHAKVWDLGLGPDDVVAQNSAACFDVSVWQFLCALLVGGRTEVMAEEVNRDAAALLAETERRGVTVLEIVPSQLRAMLEVLAGRPAAAPPLLRLRWLIVNGEVLPPELCRDWLARYPHAAIVNAYGPTECSDDVTHHKIAAAPDDDCLRLPIGRSLPNMRLYVLDGRLRPLPPGLAGQLFVGGVGVGRGYLGDPVRTAVTFRPDPFAAAPGGRLYATGDRARFLDDGSLDFLGRLDHQVKLRGYRVETREIEAVLRSHPGVSEAVVVVRPDASGQDRLLAYVVADPAPAAGALRAHVQERLQEYMVPAAFVALDALPLLDNGKIDRRSLPEPGPEAFATGAALVAPRTPTEEALAGLWAETLGLEEVGIHDSFFDLGGHSLLAMQLVARVRQAFGVELPLVRLFEGPTIAELAAVVTELEAAQLDPEELARLIAGAAGR
jgi:amino acid adenylation domain-containing protein